MSMFSFSTQLRSFPANMQYTCEGGDRKIFRDTFINALRKYFKCKNFLKKNYESSKIKKKKFNILKITYFWKITLISDFQEKKIN